MPTRADFRERRAQRNRRERFTSALIIGGIVLLVAFVVLLPSLAPVGDITLPAAFAYPSPDDHAIGDPDAPVVIEEFSDFQCPFCRRFHDDTFPQIVEEYVQTGKAYFVYRHFPIVDRNDPAQESQPPHRRPFAPAGRTGSGITRTSCSPTRTARISGTTASGVSRRWPISSA
jgi:hypothetical protein